MGNMNLIRHFVATHPDTKQHWMKEWREKQLGGCRIGKWTQYCHHVHHLSSCFSQALARCNRISGARTKDGLKLYHKLILEHIPKDANKQASQSVPLLPRLSNSLVLLSIFMWTYTGCNFPYNCKVIKIIARNAGGYAPLRWFLVFKEHGKLVHKMQITANLRQHCVVQFVITVRTIKPLLECLHALLKLRWMFLEVNLNQAKCTSKNVSDPHNN